MERLSLFLEQLLLLGGVEWKKNPQRYPIHSCMQRKEEQADFSPINSRYCFLNIMLDMKQLYSGKTSHDSQALRPSLF